MHLILAAALLAQVPDGDVFPAGTQPPSDAAIIRLDLAFANAVEDSILREPGTKVPESYRNLIELLGCDAYLGREDATTRLESAIRRDPAAMRWMFWGRRHRDPEVRHRCNAIVRRLAPKCPACNGTGRSKWGADYECLDCGAMPMWAMSPWD